MATVGKNKTLKKAAIAAFFNLYNRLLTLNEFNRFRISTNSYFSDINAIC